LNNLQVGKEMEAFSGERLTKLFRLDEVYNDNFLFKLHHQVNFFVILVGVVFIFGENYLNGNSIVCRGGDDYSNQYCWLHGTGHLPSVLAKDITGLCAMDQTDVTKDHDRETYYYLWLPFLLAICMGLVKMPRNIWKNLCERGMIKSMVRDGDEMGEKIAARFNKLKNRSACINYHVCFAVCELLNIVMLIISFLIMDSLLNGKFWSYGIDVNNYYGTKPSLAELQSNPGLEKPNPMCSLFPTVVACNIKTGSISGGAGDKDSLICILSNNLFNQYFFLILWLWWIILLFISALGLIYRAAQMSMPAISKAVLETYLRPLGLENKINKLDHLRPSDYFVLGRLAINLKGSTMEDLMDELTHTRLPEENMVLTTAA